MNSMKDILTGIFFIICVLSFSCKKETVSSYSLPTGSALVVSGSKVISYNQKVVEAELGFFVCRNNEIISEPLNAANYDYTDSYTGFKFELISSCIVAAPVNGPSSTLILLDQSGDCEVEYRFEGVNHFFKNLMQGNSAAFAAYSRQGQLKNDIVFLTDYYHYKWSEEVAGQVLLLSEKTGGSSCLYDALIESISFAAERSPAGSRSVTVLVNGPDGGSQAGVDDVIAAALEADVNLNVISDKPGSSADNINFTRLAYKTGGFYANFCLGITRLSVLYNLNTIMAGGYNYCSSVLRITSPGNTFHPGYEEIYWDYFNDAGLVCYLISIP